MTLAPDPPGSRYTDADDDRRIEQLSPALRNIACGHLLHTQAMVRDLEADFRVHIGETYRDPARQWELFKRGRIYDHERRRWVVRERNRIVTNARPDKTAHCVTLDDGTPDARAYHITLFEPDADRLIPDRDPRWALAVAALAEIGGLTQKITAGAFFRSIPGGDWAHFEQTDWRREARR